jgi:hypothetical protein
MKVNSNPNLDKNKFGLIVNSNRNDYNKYMEDKKIRVRMDKLESDINSIKDMLVQLLNKEP